MALSDWTPLPGRPTLADDEVHVTRLVLRGAATDLPRMLSGEERARAARLGSADLRRRYVVAHCGLRLILARYLGTEASALTFLAGPRGKPELTIDGRSPSLCFNLSHSEDLALVAVARHRAVGVDVERIATRASLDALAVRALSPEAAEVVLGAPSAERPGLFHQAWARREAAVKCTGAGLSGPPPDQSIEVIDLDAGPRFAAALAVEGVAAPRLRLFDLAR